MTFSTTTTELTYEQSIKAGLAALKDFRAILAHFGEERNTAEFQKLRKEAGYLSTKVTKAAAGFADKLHIKGDLADFVAIPSELHELIRIRQGYVAGKDEKKELKQTANNILVAFREHRAIVDLVVEDEQFLSTHSATVEEFKNNLERCRENFQGAGKSGRLAGAGVY